VVLSGNILRAAPEKIKDLRVDLTIVDGEVRYRKRLLRVNIRRAVPEAFLHQPGNENGIFLLPDLFVS